MEGTTVEYLYTDAGDGYGEWRVEQFRMVQFPDGLDLIWEQQGDFAFPYTGVQLHLHGIKLQQAWIDDKEVAVGGQQLECQPFAKAYFKGELAATMP